MNNQFAIFRIKNILLTLFVVFLIFYFIYHSFNGERGIFVYLKLNSEYESLHNALDSARAERLEIEHKVNLLQPGSLDLDVLEEQAKSVLSYAKEKEEIYIVTDKKQE